MRNSICNPITDATTRTVERNGNTYEQNTANIGKTKPADATAPDDGECDTAAQTFTLLVRS